MYFLKIIQTEENHFFNLVNKGEVSNEKDGLDISKR